MNNTIVKTGAMVVVGAALFFGGMAYGRGSAGPMGLANLSSADRQARFAQFGGMGGGRGANGGFASGEVLSQDATGITIKMRDGSSKIVILAGSTEIMKSVSGVAKDVTVGQNVTVMGTANSDGSITAQTVQIRPAMPAGQKTN